MVEAENNQELTSTLHLGLRTVVDGSPESALSLFLSTATADEKSAVEAISSGDGTNSMIFIHRGPSKGSRFLISSKGSSIGRSSESEIFLDDVTVSRSHAQVSKIEGGFHLVDQGSLNGTYVNNVSVTDVALTNGDEIQIGKFHMLFIGAQNNKTGEK
jgi:hypothetical protein